MISNQARFWEVKVSSKEIDIPWHAPLLRFPKPLVRVEHSLAFPHCFSLSLVSAGGLRATPERARNTAETSRGLKSLTWNMFELVLRNWDWQNHQASSSYCGICHVLLCFDRDALKPSSVIRKPTVAETHAHKGGGNWGSARWRISSSSRTLGSAVRLWDSHLPTACVCPSMVHIGTSNRSIEISEISYKML